MSGAGFGRRGRVGMIAMLAAALALDAGAAAAGPEVVRVRVPAKDVTRYFPPGTGLRILSPREFESLVEEVRREPERAAAPRLIRARHRVRWDSGLLRGHSELILGTGGTGPAEFPLVPWTPALLVGTGTAPAVGARDSGAAVLRVDGPDREPTIGLDWEQRPRPDSGGRGFSLGLPAVDTTVLELELPRGWTAASQRGVRRGPVPGEDPATSLWELDGDAGRFDVVLADASDRGKAGPGASAWMSTTTEVDLRRSTDLAGSMVNWTADLRVELDPRRAGRLEAMLDPGLELIDVRGDAVQGHRTDRTEAGTRVAVALAEGVRSATVRLLAHATVRAEGDWTIPAVRPLDAIWTGGRTTVILDEGHAVRTYRERAGRLVPSPRDAAGGARRMTFEASAPRSVADLVLARPGAELACTARGQLSLAGAPARVDCRLEWALLRGSVAQVEFDLSPAWSPDQVRLEGHDDPLAWHSSRLPSGATRVRVMLPASMLSAGRWTLTVGAASDATAPRGPIELPRAHPVGAAVVDEAWLAWGDDGTTIRPVRARGLAWIDPAEVPGLAAPAPPPGLRPALAWRWTADDAEARVDRERIDPAARASIHATARLTPDARGFSIDGTIRVAADGAPMDVLPLRADGPGDPMSAWHFLDEDGGELRPRPLDAAARARLGWPRDASARALVLDLPAHGRKTVSFRAAPAWSSPGLVPLLSTGGHGSQEGTFRIETPVGMSARFRAVGPGRLQAAATGPTPGDAGSPDRVVHAFSYAGPGAHLELVAEPMEATPMPGVVRDALLATTWDGGGRTLHRLRLLVQPGPAESLSFELPDGAELVRIRHDGAEVTPIRSDRRVTIPAPSPGGAARSSTIVADYVMEGGSMGDGTVLRPEFPRPEIPCLSFTWEVSVPPGWRLLDPGAGLVASEPRDPAGWPCGPLGLERPDWSSALGRGRTDLAGRLGRLDGRLGRPAPEELTLAEWFSRWDAGPWPVVVDRLSLGAAGLGPRASCFPGRLPPDRRDSALAMLRQQGLAAVPIADALLITTESERPRFERREPWLGAIAEALAWGADRGDRLQSVSRWRGEAAPRAASVADPAAVANRPPPGREPLRFSAPGWPGADAFVHLADARRGAMLGWIVAGLIGVAWLSTSARAPGRRLALPAMAAAACVLLARLLPARSAALTAGAFAGALAVLAVELARRIRRAPAAPSATVRSESSLVRVAARASTGPAALLIVAAAIGSPRAATAVDEPPIVALFPYEGAFDPAQPPDRVILRLDDFRRLTARGADPDSPRSTVVATASGHRVTRKSAAEVLVETEIELAARGPGPFAWRLPVSSSREITATIGGEPVPIAVEPGGEAATVALPGAGHYVLGLRRWASARVDEAGAGVLSLPVNPTPSARLVVATTADGPRRCEAEARGRIERKPDRSLDARLGPADRIVARWDRPGRAVDARLAGPVEGLILWDVTPAGDRVRERLTFHRADEIAAVRLAHDAGVILRSVRAAGKSRVYTEDDPERGHWLVSFDPPLPPEATVTVDAWRPAPAAATAGRAVVRELPGIRPASAERFAGLLGVRRPGDWTGRLAPLADTEPIDDEAFVRAWGSLPEEPLTLSGTSRFARDLAARLDTGPAPPRVLVHPALQVRIESGRLVLAADADLEATAQPPVLEAELPEGLRVTQVIGDGLVDWTASADRRLRLTWQRAGSGPRRHVRVLGWIPIVEDPLRPGDPPHRIRTPWVGWPGAEPGPGTLTVQGPTRVEILNAAGLAPAPSPAPTATTATTAAEPAAPAGHRVSYVVDDPTRLGELSWDRRPPQVSVGVESQLTVGPDFADWVAVIRYEVLGGPLGRINLRIPAAWAEHARLDHPGDGPMAPTQVVGPSAFWTIAPDRPLWGSHRFVLRSALALGAAAEVRFPEVAPLGRQGKVDAYLRIANATGRTMAAADATGVRRILPIFHAARFGDREFARDGGTPMGTYHVEGPTWALRIPLSPGAGPPGGRDDARASLADVQLAVMADRSTLGRAMYEVAAEGGRLLTVELAPGSAILWAAVEPNPAVPLRAGPSTWSIPVDPAQPGRVCVIWRTPPPEATADGSGAWPLPLPRAGRDSTRTLVSVSAPEGIAVESVPAGFEPAGVARLDKARADWLGQSIRDALPKLDRSSGRDHERLVAMLINHEQALRTAEREARRGASTARGPVGQRELIASIVAARSGIEAAVRSAGLGEDLDAAKGYLGLAPDPANRPPGRIPEPTVPCRIRSFGRPSAAIGSVGGAGDPPARPELTLGGVAGEWPFDVGNEWAAMLALALAVAAIAATSMEDRRAPLAAAGSLVLVLAAAALAGGPAMLGGGLALAAGGRLLRDAP